MRCGLSAACGCACACACVRDFVFVAPRNRAAEIARLQVSVEAVNAAYSSLGAIDISGGSCLQPAETAQQAADRVMAAAVRDADADGEVPCCGQGEQRLLHPPTWIAF